MFIVQCLSVHIDLILTVAIFRVKQTNNWKPHFGEENNMLEALFDTLGIMYCTMSAYCSKILSFGVFSDEINFKPLNNKLFYCRK